MQTFQSLLTQELARALAAADLPAIGEVVPASDARFGDYQSNAALVLAKQRGENPRALAQKIIAQLDVANWCERAHDCRRRFHQFLPQAGGGRGQNERAFGRRSPRRSARQLSPAGS